MPENLKSFRIGDLRRPEVKRSAGSQAAPEQEAAESSLGFPAIEARLEGGDMDALIEEISPRYGALEALSGSGDRRSQAAAKRAMAAYERAADLFEYLYATKEALAQPEEP